MTTKRYVASEEYEHGCCWRASVIDRDVGGPPRRASMVCECDDMEIAQLIADLLNAHHEGAEVLK